MIASLNKESPRNSSHGRNNAELARACISTEILEYNKSKEHDERSQAEQWKK